MADNLFTWIDALYNKSVPEGTPPLFMMHRFLASDRDLAIVARYLQLDLRHMDPHIGFRVWQGMLPTGRGAPRFSYVARKKPAAAEDLTTRMMQVLGESRQIAEEMQVILAMAPPVLDKVYLYFGIEPPEKGLGGVPLAASGTNGEKRKPKKVKKGGLLDY